MENGREAMEEQEEQEQEQEFKGCEGMVHMKKEEEATSQEPVRNADAEFRRGLEELMRDHLDSCMALAGSSSSFQALQDDDDSGCSRQPGSDADEEVDGQGNHETGQEGGSRLGRLVSRWYDRRAEQVITTMERQARQAELLALAGLHAVSMLDSSFLRDSQRGSSEAELESVERPQPRRTSRLVQMWRELEGERRAETGSLPARNDTSPPEEEEEESSGVNSEERTHPGAEEPTETARQPAAELGEAPRASVRQMMNRWMNERVSTHPNTSLSRRERNELLDLSERERVRELAREWLRSNRTEQPEPETTTVDWEAQRRRDRQLILDLLMRTERERQQELEGLSEHRAVSSFAHRGRLQSLLRGRFLVNSIRQEEEQQEEENVSSAARELGQLRQRRAVSGLREGFRSRLETIIRSQASSGTGTASSSEDASRTTADNRWNPSSLEDATDAELRELIGRRSVTNILASEFRERLDHLIRSFIHRQVPWPEAQAVQQEAEQQRHERTEEEETRAQQAPPPPPPPPMQTFWQPEFVQRQWPRPMTRNGYMVWDNTSQLRADISRLQQGLVDLQRLVETCVDMQLELQRSIRQEVAGAMQRMYDAGKGFPSEEVADGSQWTPVRKGICCICCDKTIDSLLYRCGHMCMCLKCANTLMQSGSKCPMCRAPIVEVVRAYTIS